MVRKRRPENKGLPPRWRLYHGAYYYAVPKGLEARWDGRKQFRLGTSLPEAHRVWAERVDIGAEDLITVGQLLDKYAAIEVPTKAPATRPDNLRAIKRLKAVFGHMPVLGFGPHHAYGYRERRKATPTAANRELEVLSHAFTKAFEWGVQLKIHPMIDGKFRKLKTPPRERYIEDWELAAMLGLPSLRKRGSVRAIQAYLKVKLLTGRRRVELLRLKIADCTEDGPVFQLSKQKQTGLKSLSMKWSQALHDAIDEAKAARPVDISPWVFCDRHGDAYLKDDGTVSDGWDSMWGRFVARVLAETDVKERFTEHDLRAKTGSDAVSLERAQELLQHLSPATTKRVYRRRDRVEPLR